MSYPVLARNDNTFRISPVVREEDGGVETTVVFSVTMFDSEGNPLSGLTALDTAYRPTKRDNAVKFLGVDLDLEPGTGYYIEAAATGAFTDKINFEQVPVSVRRRTG